MDGQGSVMVDHRSFTDEGGDLLETEFSTPQHEHGHGPFPPSPRCLCYLLSRAESVSLVS